VKTILKTACILLAAAVFLMLGINSLAPPKGVGAGASKDEFSSERAMAHVEKITSEIHPIGSPENARVRDYITGELEKLGLKPEIQKTLASNNIWGDVVTGNVENIYAVLKGAEGGSTILMAAHYDSTPRGPGASDDASGVAALLETIRALKEGKPVKNDIIFLFTDGEEVGLLGASAFTQENPLIREADMAVNLEARGNEGSVIMFETAEENGWFMKEFKKAVPYPVAYSFAYDVYKRMPNDTDFTMFKRAGVGGFNFAPVAGVETYHSTADNAANLAVGILQHEGSYALSIARHFGNLDLKDRLESNGVYFTLLKGVMILYSDKWALPLAALALVLLIAVLAAGSGKKYLSVGKTARGLLASLPAVIGAAAVGFIGGKIFDSLYYKKTGGFTAEELAAVMRRSDIWMLVMIFLTAVVIWLLYRLFKRRISCGNLLGGLLVLWMILAAVSAFMFKGASYMFAWPLLLTLCGFIIQLLLTGKRGAGLGPIILFILSAASCILIYLPIGYLLFETMTIKAAPILTGILALPFGIMILSASMMLEKQRGAEVKAGTGAAVQAELERFIQ
jgi:hypothetical protein